MKEIEKMQAGLEYCYDDEDISMMKLHAIENANVFNSLAEDDLDKQHEVLSEILGSVGEKVWIAKRFCFDNGKNIFIGNNFTGNFNLTILDIKEVYIGDNTHIENCIVESHDTIRANTQYKGEPGNVQIVVEKNERYVL